VISNRVFDGKAGWRRLNKSSDPLQKKKYPQVYQTELESWLLDESLPEYLFAAWGYCFFHMANFQYKMTKSTYHHQRFRGKVVFVFFLNPFRNSDPIR
jgi:CDP-diacylglycerol pyrophosphatase